MPDKIADVMASGCVTDLFAHRFVIATGEAKILADLGPKGAEKVRLAIGDEVKLTGEQKPSEIKVHTLAVGGRDYVLKPGPGAKHADEEETALAAVRVLGFEPFGPVRRKPKHFEILARRGDERLQFHVEFDGAIRKAKPDGAPA